MSRSKPSFIDRVIGFEYEIRQPLLLRSATLMGPFRAYFIYSHHYADENSRSQQIRTYARLLALLQSQIGICPLYTEIDKLL